MIGSRCSFVVLIVISLSLIATSTRGEGSTKTEEGNCDQNSQRQKKSVFFQPESIKKTDTTITGTPPCETESRTIKLCAVVEIHQKRELQKYCVDQQPLRRDSYYVLDYYE